jgi:hypothetical protein
MHKFGIREEVINTWYKCHVNNTLVFGDIGLYINTLY